MDHAALAHSEKILPRRESNFGVKSVTDSVGNEFVRPSVQVIPSSTDRRGRAE